MPVIGMTKGLNSRRAEKWWRLQAEERNDLKKRCFDLDGCVEDLFESGKVLTEFRRGDLKIR